MQFRTIAHCALAVLVLVALFFPALGGGYRLDDNINLVSNTKVQLNFGDENFLSRAMNSGIASDLGRPISMLSFAFEHAIYGSFEPAVSKTVNLIIHTINMLMLILVIRALAEICLRFDALNDGQAQSIRRWAPLIALLWAILPTNVSAVVYVIQRMNLLAVFFVLMTLYLYLVQRIRVPKIWLKLVYLAGALLALALGILSKENAVLAVVFIVGLELLLWYRESIFRFRVKAISLVAILLILVAVVVPWWAETGLADQYLQRPFDWSTRLLLQPLALIWYSATGFIPLFVEPHFYMDFLESPEFLSIPLIAWLALAIFILFLLWFLYKVAIHASLLVFLSIGWFLIFHLVESTFWPLEIAFLHRNYLPSIGLVLGLSFVLVRHINKRPKHMQSVIAIVATYFLCTATSTALESMRWGDDYTLAATEAEMKPGSYRASFSLGMWYLNNDPADLFCEEMDGLFEDARRLSVDNISGFYGKILAAEKCNWEFDQQTFNNLNTRIAEQPLSASTLHFLDLLSESCRQMQKTDCSKIYTLANTAFGKSGISTGYRIEYGMLLAKLAYYLDDYAETIRYAEAVLALEPDFPRAHLTMLDVMYSSGSCEGLRAALDVLGDGELVPLLERDIQPMADRYPECFADAE